VTVREPPTRIDTSKMSEGKRAALELAESARTPAGEMPSFAGPLFFGTYRWPLIGPFPEEAAESRARGEEFLASLTKFVDEHLDPDEIDRTGEIPESVVDGLRALGAFGIKIPREYGGLGLSQTTYTKAAMLVGGRCASTAALLSAHQSIGVPQPLLLFGTDEQKSRFLPRLAKGELSAFAITEADAGSDPARMTSRAELSADGTHYVLTGEKLWCTNGTRAKWLVVAAKTKSAKPGGRDEITAFIVDGEAAGVSVPHRCRFMGMRAIYNAVVRFDGVKVPRENVLGGEGRGLKVALTTLNTGRLTLPAACVGLAKECLAIARRWAASREQWGAPVGRHAAVAEKIARMAADLFAMESMTLLTSALVDRHDTDIRVEAAMCKMWGTEAAWRIVNDAVQVKGGRGYETAESLAARGDAPDPLERYVRDNRIYTIFEGSSEILRLFLAREALDPHLAVSGEVLDSRVPAGRRLVAALKAGAYYAAWYPSRLLPAAGAPAGTDPDIARHIDYCAATSRRLARTLFRAMVRHGTEIEREQVLLGRFVDVGAETFALSASCARAQQLLAAGSPRSEVMPVLDLFGDMARTRIEAAFRGTQRNHDAASYVLAQDVLAGRHEWLERQGDLPPR
jgi:alkylation response protein AidB-like acyl-CoA dehydrogenase